MKSRLGNKFYSFTKDVPNGTYIKNMTKLAELNHAFSDFVSGMTEIPLETFLESRRKSERPSAALSRDHQTA